jgi:alpha-tubulin suppressor-like RCC1 family protein
VGTKCVSMTWRAICAWPCNGANTSFGNVYAWGDGANGRLGLGDVFPRYSPTRIHGLSGVARVAAGAG